MTTTSMNLQQALAPTEAGRAPQRRSFMKRASISLVALGSLMVTGSPPVSMRRSAATARRRVVCARRCAASVR